MKPTDHEGKDTVRSKILLLIYLIIIAILILMREEAQSKKPPQNGLKTGEVRSILVRVRPDLKSPKLEKIAFLIANNSNKLQIGWVTYISILIQESNLYDDPKGLGEACVDCGMSQIHFPTWKDALQLDKSKLVYDTEYSLTIGYRILKHYKRLYGHEPDWYTRYHSSTPLIRERYRIALQEKIDMVEAMRREMK